MKQIAVGVFGLGLLAVNVFAQSGAVIPQGGAGHAKEASCVILKRMGPADQVTSHMYSFGFRGKQFQYVEGKLPEGVPFHGRMTDHDVRNLQGRGAEVIILNSSYTADELKQARDDCRGETGKSPNQAEPQPPTAQQSAAATAPGAPSSNVKETSLANSAQVAQSNATKISVNSTPADADIVVDGNFVGNTPSTVEVSPGDHAITVSKSGFKDWERKLKVTGGNINLNAELEAK